MMDTWDGKNIPILTQELILCDFSIYLILLYYNIGNFLFERFIIMCSYYTQILKLSEYSDPILSYRIMTHVKSLQKLTKNITKNFH